jgi:hypothetical protein
MRHADESGRIRTSPNHFPDPETERDPADGPSGYQAPALFDLGSVRNVVLGSVGSGQPDMSGGQYKWQ